MAFDNPQHLPAGKLAIQQTGKSALRSSVRAGSASSAAGSYCSHETRLCFVALAAVRRFKHFSHEGGIHTPLIVHWPAGFKARGELRAQTGHIIDVMPTLLAVSGAICPAERKGVKIQPMEGRSLLPALANRPVERDSPLFFEHEGSRAVRDGKWMLVSLSGEAWELYDLGADPTEMHDLISRGPARARELIAAWQGLGPAMPCGYGSFTARQAMSIPTDNETWISEIGMTMRGTACLEMRSLGVHR
jgi:hypothetical protein